MFYFALSLWQIMSTRSEKFHVLRRKNSIITGLNPKFMIKFITQRLKQLLWQQFVFLFPEFVSLSLMKNSGTNRTIRSFQNDNEKTTTSHTSNQPVVIRFLYSNHVATINQPTSQKKKIEQRIGFKKIIIYRCSSYEDTHTHTPMFGLQV